MSATGLPSESAGLCLAAPATKPCGPSSLQRVHRVSLPVSPPPPGFSAQARAFAVSPFGLKQPKGPWLRSETWRLSGLRLQTTRPAARCRGDSPVLYLRRLGAWGFFVARLVGSYDEAPERRPVEALQLPIDLPLLPGNFRSFASLKPPSHLRHRLACALRCRSRESVRPREPLAG